MRSARVPASSVELDDRTAGRDVRVVEQLFDGADGPERRRRRRRAAASQSSAAAAREHLGSSVGERRLSSGRGRQLCSARSGRSMASQNAAQVRGSAAASVTSFPSAARYARAVRGLTPAGGLPRRDAAPRPRRAPRWRCRRSRCRRTRPCPVRSRSVIAGEDARRRRSARRTAPRARSRAWAGPCRPPSAPSRPE